MASSSALSLAGPSTSSPVSPISPASPAPTAIVFAGTPAFAASALARLLTLSGPDGRYTVRAVLTQPDRPAGRGQRMLASPVKTLALEHGLPVLQPQTLKDPAVQAELAAFAPDYLVVAAYGLILPEAVLALPRAEPLNIHASLLPRWRGAAPINRAIEAGDARTGVCIMRMEKGLDTGPVCLRRELAIGADETAGSLHDRLAALGAEGIVDALDGLVADRLAFEPQPEDGITYAHKLAKAETAIDWSRPAGEIARKIRAFDPLPGCQGRLASAPGVALRLFEPSVVPMSGPAVGGRAVGDRAVGDRVADGRVAGGRLTGDAAAGDQTASDRADAAPGQVIAADAEGVVLACGDGALRIGQLQRPGGRRLPARAFLAGHPIAVGDRFLPLEAGAGPAAAPTAAR